MTFFKDDEGHLHVGRIAGVVYTAALIPFLRGTQVPALPNLARAVFAVGWWMAFWDKRPSRKLSELLHHPRAAIGVALAIAALVAQIYFTGPQPSRSYSSGLLILLVVLLSFWAGRLYRMHHK
jgi:hypothetical protein